MKSWNPWTTYDLTPAEKAAREERAQMQLANKKVFQKMVTDPYSYGKGHHFDPAVQRWIAMKATQYDYFKPTPKTALLGAALLIGPIVFYCTWIYKEHFTNEALYRNGQVRYKDRESKFHS